MLTFYINLDRRTDRRMAIEEQLAALTIPATRLTAITPETIPGEVRARHLVPGGIIASELACTLSHHDAWRRLLAGDAPAALVIEDDALLSARLPEVIGLLDQAVLDFDILRLESRGIPALLDAKPALVLGGFTGRRLRSWVAGTGGYVVTRRGAETLLASDHKHIPVDRAMYEMRLPVVAGYTTLQLQPAVVTSRPSRRGIGESDIHRVRSGSRPLRQARRLLGGIRRDLGYVARLARSFLTGTRLTLTRVPFRP